MECMYGHRGPHNGHIQVSECTGSLTRSRAQAGLLHACLACALCGLQTCVRAEQWKQEEMGLTAPYPVPPSACIVYVWPGCASSDSLGPLTTAGLPWN